MLLIVLSILVHNLSAHFILAEQHASKNQATELLRNDQKNCSKHLSNCIDNTEKFKLTLTWQRRVLHDKYHSQFLRKYKNAILIITPLQLIVGISGC